MVFGGLGLDGGYLRDVYRVDGTTLAFEELRPDGARPPARAGEALIDDPGNGRVLLFGGTATGDAFADTWQADAALSAASTRPAYGSLRTVTTGCSPSNSSWMSTTTSLFVSSSSSNQPKDRPSRAADSALRGDP